MPCAPKPRTERHIPGIMNRTEQRYESEVLKPLLHSGKILAYWFESLTLKLAPDLRYTPDFLVMEASGMLCLHETKGFMRDDARVKLKMTRQQFPFVIMVCRYAKGQWSYEEVK